MKKTMWIAVGLLLAAGVGYAQDEFFKIMDFEEQEPPAISASWDFFTGFSVEGEPVHGGNYSLILDITSGTGGWNFSTWQFPADVGTVDLSNTDEINIWVNANSIFQMNFEFGGANLGYRGYTADDLGTWKKLCWWYPEETASAFTAVNSWGSFINPAAMGGFPEGFSGTIYMDDIQARIRKETPEREYFLLNGFNSDADLANVTVHTAGGIVKGGAVAPTEGDGYLKVTLSDAGNSRFTLDVTKIPEFQNYDRIHFDLYMDGTATGYWGNFGLYLDTSDASGNPITSGFTLVNGSYAAVATKQWHTFVQQYGPVQGTDGFLMQNLIKDSIAPIYAMPGASIAIRLNTNGGGVEGVPLYVDNIRLSRVKGSAVSDWDLY
ncbi:MAG: hypothetical protein AB1656_11400 [Candidatus Omnitrophota bacterium]